MEFVTTSPDLPEVVIIEPAVHRDERGFFVETYSRERFAKLGITDEFVQDNHSFSRQGVLRGLHYQVEPYAQAKLIRVITGRVFDVAVELSSGKWASVELSADNGRMVYIPAGYAHGFYAFEDTHLVYKCSAAYRPEHERGISWNDPTLAIPWPTRSPTLSERDRIRGPKDSFSKR